jgi:hypothetical protein
LRSLWVLGAIISARGIKEGRRYTFGLVLSDLSSLLEYQRGLGVMILVVRMSVMISRRRREVLSKVSDTG